MAAPASEFWHKQGRIVVLEQRGISRAYSG
jgi:hypothetical protein